MLGVYVVVVVQFTTSLQTERNNFGDICSLAGLKKLVKTTRDICFAALNIKISKAFRALFLSF